MDRNRTYEMEAWLAAETAGDEAAAEAAFGALFATLPHLHPTPGFAERVVRAALPEPARAPVMEVWGGRLALGASLALAGLAVALLPMLRALPVDPPGLTALLQGANDALAWMGGRLVAGFALWDVLARVGGAVSVAVATPQAASALLGSATLSGLALYTLDRMLTLERRNS